MRLLIAEDDKALGLFSEPRLRGRRASCPSGYDGASAVEAFRQEMPDLTILDLNLPDQRTASRCSEEFAQWMRICRCGC